jgi:hypothetical protein
VAKWRRGQATFCHWLWDRRCQSSMLQGITG